MSSLVNNSYSEKNNNSQELAFDEQFSGKKIINDSLQELKNIKKFFLKNE
jgi:hypothetical protein